MTPQVSVIVAAYNVQDYVAKCVASLKAQSLPQLQIIVIDDGSTDDTAAEIRRADTIDGHPVEYVHRRNGGLSAARNTGLRYATGEYIGFVDADDWTDPTMFAALYASASDAGSEVAVCGAWRCWPDGTRKPVEVRVPLNHYGHPVREHPEILYGSQSYAWNKIYSRALTERTGFAFPEGQVYEDSAVVYELLSRANQVTAIDQRLYFYRMARQGSITGAADESVYDVFASCDSFRTSLSSLLDGKAGDRVIEQLVRAHLMARLPALRGSNRPLLAAAYTKRAYDYLSLHFPGWQKRYPQGTQSRLQHITRRHAPLAIARSISDPFRRGARTALGNSSLQLRRRFLIGRALHKIAVAATVDSIDYIADLDTLRQSLSSEPTDLPKTIHFSVLPGIADPMNLVIQLRQQGLRLRRTHMRDTIMVGQEWSLERAGIGSIAVVFHYLQPVVGGVRMWIPDTGNPASTSHRTVLLGIDAPPPSFESLRDAAMGGGLVFPVVPLTDAFARSRLAYLADREDVLVAEAAELPKAAGRTFQGMPPSPTDDVARLRQEQLAILEAFLHVCDDISVSPMLADGSLLGAYRHGGYIPWDDDIDLWLLREDFETLMRSVLPNGLKLMHYSVNDAFHLPFAKVIKSDSAFGWRYPKDLKPSGANIDIFPLDWSRSASHWTERVRGKLVRILRQVLRAKFDFPESRRRTSRVVLAKLAPAGIWHRLLRALVVRPATPKRSYLTSWFSAYPACKASYPQRWIAAGERHLAFEHLTVGVPTDPNRVLRRTYGDYESLPPESKRTAANHFLYLRSQGTHD